MRYVIWFAIVVGGTILSHVIGPSIDGFLDWNAERWIGYIQGGMNMIAVWYITTTANREEE